MQQQLFYFESIDTGRVIHVRIRIIINTKMFVIFIMCTWLWNTRGDSQQKQNDMLKCIARTRAVTHEGREKATPSTPSLEKWDLHFHYNLQYTILTFWLFRTFTTAQVSREIYIKLRVNVIYPLNQQVIIADSDCEWVSDDKSDYSLTQQRSLSFCVIV